MARRPIDFVRLRQLIRPQQALELHGWIPTWTRGLLFRGPCPFHGSKPGSRSLSGTDRVCHCFKCHWRGDAVAAWKDLRKLEVYDAAVDLCGRLSIPVPYL